MNINQGMVGEIKLFAISSPPDGWLNCDGSAVSRTTYSDLFSLISSAYGVGDGSTTFNLPDFRGRTPIGIGQGPGLNNRVLAQSGGEENHTLDVSEIPSHQHSGSYTGFQNVTTPGTGITTVGSGNTGSTGGGGSHNNMQPYLVCNFIIKY